jgi:hypothetical protein
MEAGIKTITMKDIIPIIFVVIPFTIIILGICAVFVSFIIRIIKENHE